MKMKHKFVMIDELRADVDRLEKELSFYKQDIAQLTRQMRQIDTKQALSDRRLCKVFNENFPFERI